MIPPWSHLAHRFPLPTSLRSAARAPVLAVALLAVFVPRLAAQGVPTAFVNVSVLPMDSPEVLREMTVVVENGRISSVALAAEAVIPDGAAVVDGTGLFLMPGLVDMHAHLDSDPSPDYLKVFLAAGTTTLRNLNALPEHADWKQQVLDGDLIGPTILTSGPVIAGPPDRTLVWIFWALQTAAVSAAGLLVWLALRLISRGKPVAAPRPRARRIVTWLGAIGAASAALIVSKVVPLNLYTRTTFPQAYIVDTEARGRAEVRRQAAAGYDMIKPYDYMAPEQYLGVLQEASTEGIYAAGHLDVGISEALEAGIRDIVHVDEFLEYHTAEPLSLTGFRPVSFDYSGIPATVATVRDHDAAVVVNLTTDVNTVRYLEVGPDYFLRPEYSVLRPEYREGLQTGRVVRWTPQEEWRRDHLNPFLFELTRQLHEGGVLLLAGTDASMDNGSLPAHIHDELQLQVAAGLSPFEALRTATVNAQIVAARMGDEDLFGRIAPGYRGDLLLLRMNPLEDIRATTERVGVMTRGSWYPQAELDAMVAAFIAGFGEE